MRPESASVRNTEDKVCSCRPTPPTGSEKEGGRGRSRWSDGEDARASELASERAEEVTVIPRGTERRRERACNVCRLRECHYVSFARVR